MSSKEMNYKNLDSLVPVQNIINEAHEAVNDPNRTIKSSGIPEVLGAALGAGAGGTLSFAALYALGTTGLSAAGITSALATAGAVVGGGMVAGIGVLAAPVAVLGITGYAIFAKKRAKELLQKKERILQEAIQARDAIISELSKVTEENKDRLDYLSSLNTYLQRAIKELQSDLSA